MSYYLASGELPSKLSEVVNKMLEDGWKCQGGVFVRTFGPTEDLFFQAMIKE